MKLLRYLLQMVLGIALPLAVQVWDKRRLSVEQQERAWNAASWGAALYAFGPLSMLGWCWVTRRGWLRLALGVGTTALLLAVILAVDQVFEWAFVEG